MNNKYNNMNKLLLFALLFIFLIPFSVNADWYNINWNYRKLIEINPSMNDWIIYRDFVNETGINANYSDLRYTDYSNNTLNFCIYKISTNGTAEVFINVTPTTANSNLSIYRYWGNIGATPSENCDKVVNELHNPLHNNTVINNGGTSVNSNSNEISTTGTATFLIKNPSINFRFEFYWRSLGTSNNAMDIVLNNCSTGGGNGCSLGATGYIIDSDGPAGGNNDFYRDDVGSGITKLIDQNWSPDSNWHNDTLIKYSNSSWYWYRGNSLLGTVTDSTYTDFSYLHLTEGRSGTVYGNNFSIIRYGDRDEISSIGSLETYVPPCSENYALNSTSNLCFNSTNYRINTTYYDLNNCNVTYPYLINYTYSNLGYNLTSNYNSCYNNSTYKNNFIYNDTLSCGYSIVNYTYTNLGYSLTSNYNNCVNSTFYNINHIYNDTLTCGYSIINYTNTILPYTLTNTYNLCANSSAIDYYFVYNDTIPCGYSVVNSTSSLCAIDYICIVDTCVSNITIPPLNLTGITTKLCIDNNTLQENFNFFANGKNRTISQTIYCENGCSSTFNKCLPSPIAQFLLLIGAIIVIIIVFWFLLKKVFRI